MLMYYSNEKGEIVRLWNTHLKNNWLLMRDRNY